MWCLEQHLHICANTLLVARKHWSWVVYESSFSSKHIRPYSFVVFWSSGVCRSSVLKLGLNYSKSLEKMAAQRPITLEGNTQRGKVLLWGRSILGCTASAALWDLTFMYWWCDLCWALGKAETPLLHTTTQLLQLQSKRVVCKTREALLFPWLPAHLHEDKDALWQSFSCTRARVLQAYDSCTHESVWNYNWAFQRQTQVFFLLPDWANEI